LITAKSHNGPTINKQIVLNLITKGGMFVLNIIAGLWLVPYLIRHLGIAGYGLIPLATQITSYVGLISDAINNAFARFLTINLQSGDVPKAKQTFNSAFFSITSVLLVMFPIALVFSYFVPSLFEVSAEYVQDSRWLFIFILGMFLINTFSSIFTVSPYAMNRLDLINGAELLSLVCRISIIIALFTFLKPSLQQIGISYFASAVVMLIAGIILWKKLTPQLSIRLKDFSFFEFKNLASTGSWLIVNQIGTLLFLNIELIVVNKLFGAADGGKYAAVLQWSTLLRTLAGSLSVVLTPVILTYYARGERTKLLNLTKLSVKFMCLALALPIGSICGFSYSILPIWLGPDFRELAPLMMVMVSHLIINLSVLPLFAINIAYNKVRVPGWMTLIMGMGNVVLALLLPGMGLGMYGVALAGAIMLTAKNALFLPFYSSSILKIGKWSFIKAMIPGVAAAVSIGAISFIADWLFSIGSWLQLFMAIAAVGAVYAGAAWFILLTRDERRTLRSLLPNNIFRNGGDMA